jgi:hypothetical protein
LVALAGVGAFVLWSRPNRITRENCARIRAGMTPAEVEAILGPPGDYTTGPTDPVSMTARDWPSEAVAKIWTGNEGWIMLAIDPNGNVATHGYFTPSVPRQLSRWDNLLWRAKRQWRRWFPEARPAASAGPVARHGGGVRVGTNRPAAAVLVSAAARRGPLTACR